MTKWFCRESICIALLGLMAILTWIPTLTSPIDMRWDSGVYYTLGTSLAQGSGYRLLNEPGNIQATQYPPLVPYLIALHQTLLGTNEPSVVGRWLKISWLLLVLVFVILMYSVLRHFLSRRWVFCCMLICVLHSGFQFYAGQCSADLPFAVATAAFMFAHYRTVGMVRESLSAIAAVAAFFCRTIGVTLFVSWIADALLRKQFGRGAVRGVIALGSVLIWNSYVWRVESSAEYSRTAYKYQRDDSMFYNVSYRRNMAYVDPYKPEMGKVSIQHLIGRTLQNIIPAPKRIGTAALSHAGFLDIARTEANKQLGIPLIPAAVMSLLLAGLGCLIMIGTFLVLRQTDFLIPIYIATTLGAVSLAPWPGEFGRYMFPIIPLLLLAFFELLRTLERLRRVSGSRWLSRLHLAAVWTAVLCIVSAQLITYHALHHYRFKMGRFPHRENGSVAYEQLWYGDPDIALDQSLDWIAKHAQGGDVVAATMPQWVYLRTKLRSVMPPFDAVPATELALLDSVPVRFLVFEDPGSFVNHTANYTTKMLAAYQENWRLVFSPPGDYVRVYERIR